MLQIVRLEETNESVRRTVAGWLVEEFPYDERFSSVEAVLVLLEDVDRTAFVAMLDGVAIGTASIVRKDDLPSEFEGWFTDFVVDSSLRGHGHGGRIISACVEHVRETGGRESIYLYCEPKNREFYAKRGWVIVNEQTHTDGMPVFVMRYGF